MSSHILQLSAAGAMMVATPALATAQSVAYSTSSPVAITSFSVNESYAPGMIMEGPITEAEEAQQFIASGIVLKFVNKSNVPATTVKFFVNDGKFTQSIVDKGTFGPRRADKAHLRSGQQYKRTSKRHVQGGGS